MGSAPSESPAIGVNHRLWFLAACGCFLAATLIVFGDVLCDSQGRVLSDRKSDIENQFVAWREFGFNEMSHGHLTLWNPHVYGGTPYFGGFQSALLYPPNWLYLTLGLARAINLGIAIHVFLAGLFVYLWTRHRGLHPLACITGGLVFMFSGPYFLHIIAGHLPNLCTMIWAPLVLLAVDMAMDGSFMGGAMLGASAVAMQIFAGHPQYVFYTAVAAGIYALLQSVRCARRAEALGACALMYLGGAALAAVQLFAGLDATAESLRTHMSLRVAGTYSFLPQNFLTLLLPGIYGDVTRTPYWGYSFLWENCLFIGVVAGVLALFAVCHATHSTRRFSLLMAVICMLLALGKYTPWFRFLYACVPGFASFRGNDKFIFLVALFAAMLAAIGLDALLRVRPSRRWPVAAAAAGIVLVALGALIARSAGQGVSGVWAREFCRDDWRTQLIVNMDRQQDPGLAVSAGLNVAKQLYLAGGTFIALSLILGAARRRQSLACLLALLLAVEMIVFARSYRPTFPIQVLDPRPRAVARYLADAGFENRIWSDQQSVALRSGEYDAWGNDPMVLRRYGEFVAFIQAMPPDQINSRRWHGSSPLWRIIRLKYLLRFDGDQPEFIAVGSGPVLRRAQLIDSFQVITDPGAMLAALDRPSFDPAKTVLLEKAPDPAPAVGNPGAIDMKDLSTDLIDIRVRTSHPSVLLMTDNYSKGWHAVAMDDSDQRTYQVMPADYTVRAIPLAAGTHHFLLEYRPVAFVVGAWVSLAAWLAYGLAGILLWRRRRVPPADHRG